MAESAPAVETTRNEAKTRARDIYIVNKRKWYAQKIAQGDTPGRRAEGIDYLARLVEFEERYEITKETTNADPGSGAGVSLHAAAAV